MIALAVAVVVLADAAPVSARTTLDLCTSLSRSRLEDRVGTPLGKPHDLSTEAVAAGCHFPASAIGGTDVGIYASNDVPAGIRHSYGGSFFATLDSFGQVYGTPTPVPRIGTSAYVAYTPGSLAQGALLVLDGPRHAVLVVLVGKHVTAANALSRGCAIARMVLALPKLRQ